MLSIDEIIDGYRLTPLGWLDQVDMQMIAVCDDGVAVGDNGGFLIVVRQADADTLLINNSRLERIWGVELSELKMMTVRQFVGSHEDALAAHWKGRIDSIELVERIQKQVNPRKV